MRYLCNTPKVKLPHAVARLIFIPFPVSQQSFQLWISSPFRVMWSGSAVVNAKRNASTRLLYCFRCKSDAAITGILTPFIILTPPCLPLPPQNDRERDHKVRLALGNGIRADTWADFLERFGDIRICECYGATEGNIGFVNYIGKIGAIGKEHFLHKVRREEDEVGAGFEMPLGSGAVSDGMPVRPHSLRHRERGAGPRFQRILR